MIGCKDQWVAYRRWGGDLITDPLLCRTREWRDGGVVLLAVERDGELVSVGGEDFVDDVVCARGRTRGGHVCFNDWRGSEDRVLMMG